MHHGLAARHVATTQDERTGLHSERALHPHGRAYPAPVRDRPAQVDVHAVPAVVVVSQDGDAALVVDVDDIEVAVAAEVAERRPEGHALLVEAPGRANVLESEVA